MNYDAYEQSEAQIKANVDIEKARINAEALKYEKKLDSRAGFRDQTLMGLAITGVASVILSVIWSMYLDFSGDGERKDQLRNDCQSAGGTWVPTDDYDDYTCIPAGSDIKPKDVYKKD